MGGGSKNLREMVKLKKKSGSKYALFTLSNPLPHRRSIVNKLGGGLNCKKGVMLWLVVNFIKHGGGL